MVGHVQREEWKGDKRRRGRGGGKEGEIICKVRAGGRQRRRMPNGSKDQERKREKMKIERKIREDSLKKK